MQSINITNLSHHSSVHQKKIIHTLYQPSTYQGHQFVVALSGTNQNNQNNLTNNHHATIVQQQKIIYQPEQNYNGYAQAPVYSSISGAFYPSNAELAEHVSQLADTYVMNSYTDNLETEVTTIPNTIRASPASVKWLLDNYETCEGVSLPRSTLYNHYLAHCADNYLEPMNPASFGKLIRSVFLGLRTRRLGTRGNSQYHYYGIRVKSMSTLNKMNNISAYISGTRQLSSTNHTYLKRKANWENSTLMVSNAEKAQQQFSYSPSTIGKSNGLEQQQTSASAIQKHQDYLGEAGLAVTRFGSVNNLNSGNLPEGVMMEDVSAFETLYKDHCEAFLEIVVNLQFNLIETLWMSFWRNVVEDPDNEEIERRLPKAKLITLCQLPQVWSYVQQSDYSFYQALIHILVPDVLRPIPGSLSQSIRTFSKCLEGWLLAAMKGFPKYMIKIKISAVNAFSQMLRRYTSLNHLAQAARAVLQNSSQMSQMVLDISKVDFYSIHEQASWVCNCERESVIELEQDFKNTLQRQLTLEEWTLWLQKVVDRFVVVETPIEIKSKSENDRNEWPSSGDQVLSNFDRNARQFLLKWSFYSSLVIRDLTLRSASSFGSFHLIRLLLDEYMYYLLEHKVAQATGQTCIAIIGRCKNQDSDINSFPLNIPDDNFPNNVNKSNTFQSNFNDFTPYNQKPNISPSEASFSFFYSNDIKLDNVPISSNVEHLNLISTSTASTTIKNEQTSLNKIIIRANALLQKPSPSYTNISNTLINAFNSSKGLLNFPLIKNTNNSLATSSNVNLIKTFPTNNNNFSTYLPSPIKSHVTSVNNLTLFKTVKGSMAKNVILTSVSKSDEKLITSNTIKNSNVTIINNNPSSYLSVNINGPVTNNHNIRNSVTNDQAPRTEIKIVGTSSMEGNKVGTSSLEGNKVVTSSSEGNKVIFLKNIDSLSHISLSKTTYLTVASTINNNNINKVNNILKIFSSATNPLIDNRILNQSIPKSHINVVNVAGLKTTPIIDNRNLNQSIPKSHINVAELQTNDGNTPINKSSSVNIVQKNMSNVSNLNKTIKVSQLISMSDVIPILKTSLNIKASVSAISNGS